ncbi:MAG: DUF3570 domain-containing protein [Bacteroidia bacterium]
MRLQLILILAVLTGSCVSIKAQQPLPDSIPVSTLDSLRPSLPVDAHFLLSYYEQDGNHSAVTGGTGTEELQDIASRIIVNVPVDSVTRISVDLGMNHYTSASTDRIDSRISSASRKDNHVEMYFGYEKDIPKRKMTYGLNAGGSIESDYLSTSAGGKWSKMSENENREIMVGAQVFLDTWVLIFPEELRTVASQQVHTDKRRSYSVSVRFSQVLNRRMEAQATAELVYQHGLLSTPFHRVYFENEDMARIEKLPESRWKYPVGLHLNYFVTDWLVLRSYYRFYADDFGIIAHTARLETPLKFSPFFALLPFYRFHNQHASDYFAPFAAHLQGEEFYTSDFDLSSFSSRKMGMAARYAPLRGLARFKLRESVLRLRSVEIRYARYRRSDGLEANMGTLHLAFILP